MKRPVRTVSIQLPEPMDNYFGGIAKSRLVSKASVVREVLLEHVKEKHPELMAELQKQAEPSEA